MQYERINCTVESLNNALKKFLHFCHRPLGFGSNLVMHNTTSGFPKRSKSAQRARLDRLALFGVAYSLSGQ